ncbi:DNA-directed RNA polymerase subunit RPC12/RpoP [Methanofollis sp. W23]|uniref:hypothetical protein n=1 Tax=Methanofollis sp. W23 TaxID=2817849 RepID=UPI001AEAB99E|nr:hypothetical protein [Methanofollis sp. W23]MBP2145513.1 DNA-directed RNA polymerase subunit RPC12/RpoP [Methanofollis sp. W23]
MLRCPRCGSTDLYQVLGGYAGMTYRCKRCGYTGSFVVESEDALPMSPGEEGVEAKPSVPVYRGVRIAALVLLLFLALWYLIRIL